MDSIFLNPVITIKTGNLANSFINLLNVSNPSTIYFSAIIKNIT
ncbi:hypothetical protein BGAPBR_I0055 (plasmid) [Borreliella garinii PBr]|uniref:Uncharacterized protein n=1 Tax=Borreliella garinii PBr TaxID=498743 RepID=B8F134_BORGR|nr:hypothetical protein BGAPBR_I0055 [Borreliella garinii PBr]